MSCLLSPVAYVHQLIGLEGSLPAPGRLSVHSVSPKSGAIPSRYSETVIDGDGCWRGFAGPAAIRLPRLPTDHSAAPLATSVAESTKMPTSAACGASASLPRRRGTRPHHHRAVERARYGPLLRTDPSEHGGARDRHGEWGVIEGVEVGAGQRVALAQPEVAADLDSDCGIVPRRRPCSASALGWRAPVNVATGLR